MTRILVAALLCLLVLPAWSQTTNSPQQFAAVGVSWNQYASPQVNGLLVYARRLTSNNFPTYSFTAVNIVSATKEPFRVATTTETGVAQHLTVFGPFSVYGIGTGGMVTTAEETGTRTSYVVTGGGLALAGIGRGWRAGPYLRIIKSALSERQWAVGAMLGWGQ